MIFTSLAK